MSKTRVAPLQRLTFPRLELQGAVLAVRLKEAIISEMKISFKSMYFWTHSTLNLQYINNEQRRFKVFVANRIAEIRLSSEPIQWRHVQGRLNPADLATRGARLNDLVRNNLWLKGPEFLQDEQLDLESESIDAIDPMNEKIKQNKPAVNVTAIRPSFIEFDRFSNWHRVINTVAWIHIFIDKLLKRTNQNQTSVLSLDRQQQSEMTIFKIIQADMFEIEINLLKQHDQTPKGSSIKNLDPFLDDQNLLRVGARLKLGKFPYATKHQIILPTHHVVSILLRNLHYKYHHVGKEQLLSIVRQRFWPIKGRKMISKVISKCIKCQNVKAKPCDTKMSNLPADRLEVAPPFSNTGIDYFGPITVKILRSRAKRWGCIFTCLTTRAIHLEVAPSMETDDFLNVLERFVNRRGCPKIVLSDCGTNFKGADRVLQNEWIKLDKERSRGYANKKNFEWIFNPPEAPHMGGVWERIIRSVKTTLKVILAEQSINDFTLMTVFTQVEAILNGRPLTHISDDIRDLEALTPNHFLIGRPDAMVSIDTIQDELKTSLRKRWGQTQELTTQFWNRWLKDYIPSLTKRQKWCRDKTASSC